MAFALAPSAASQPLDRPGQRELEVPRLPGERQPVLPPAPEPLSQERERLPGTQAIRVDHILFEGNTAFSDAALAELCAGYMGRALSGRDLRALRELLTRHYVRHGYATSSARIPDQRIESHSLRVQLVEGRLAEVEIRGNRHYRASVLRRRIEAGISAPLHVGVLEQRLQRLQHDPRIQRVAARLRPGPQRGEAALVVELEERVPALLRISTQNHAPPTVGAIGGAVEAAHLNPLRLGDRLQGSFWGTEGLRRVELRYEVPLGAFGTALGFAATLSESEVVEPPFDALDIENEFRAYAVELRQTWDLDADTRLALSLGGTYRRSISKLDGEPFSFVAGPVDESIPFGPDHGRAEVAALRLAQEWAQRRASAVVALRSALRIGLDAPGVTRNRGDRVPDGQFVSWLGQLRWIQQAPWFGLESHLRVDVQLADRPLMSLEQFGLGGPGTVRGYRRNVRVRDQAWVASWELRLPLLERPDGLPILVAAPFVDVGRAWDRGRRGVSSAAEGPSTLVALGLGLRWSVTRHLRAELYWAQSLRHVAAPSDLQQEGVYFSVRWDLLDEALDAWHEGDRP